MLNRPCKMIAGAVIAGVIILLSGCGAPKPESDAGSFSDASPAAIVEDSPAAKATETTEPVKPAGSDTESIKEIDPAIETVNDTEMDLGIDLESNTESGAENDSKATRSPGPDSPDGKESAAKDTQTTVTETATPPTPSDAANVRHQETTLPEKTPAPASEAKTSTKSKYAQITWNGFFDNEDQTTPSEQFWDLSDAKSTVQIKGFMGEVLSLDKNWFLLIPEPGAECPFDNGDETYWNKIMIVFVSDGTKLRYTSKPLQITGRLDVGIKVDESGYKTMFRLYDAKFEEMKG